MYIVLYVCIYIKTNNVVGLYLGCAVLCCAVLTKRALNSALIPDGR